MNIMCSYFILFFNSGFTCVLFEMSILPFLFHIAELDALEADMGLETEADGVPSYLQPDKEPDLDAELNLPSAPMGQTAPAGRSNAHVCSF